MLEVLRSILENILLKTMYDLPSQDNVEEVIVDASAAKGNNPTNCSSFKK